MNHIAVRGVSGEVRWAYHRAASLGPWTLDGGHLTASIADGDAFRLSQQPLTFVVRRPGGALWTWPIVDLTVDGAALRATVSTQE